MHWHMKIKQELCHHCQQCYDQHYINSITLLTSSSAGGNLSYEEQTTCLYHKGENVKMVMTLKLDDKEGEFEMNVALGDRIV